MAKETVKEQMNNQILIEQLPNGFSFEMIFVEGSSFLMGSEEEAFEWEQPVHEVTLKSYYIGNYPVTQGLWKSVMGSENNPSFFQGDLRPVESVSWVDIQSFLKQLRSQTGKAYRLLSEAEWEYAARGGKHSRGCKYAGGNKLSEVGWYDENSHEETKGVRMKRPNELGIYDMSGNVWEWVEDHWHDNYEGATVDGTAWVDKEEGSFRVYRGGGWGTDAGDCRVSCRSSIDPSGRLINLGFRLGLSLQ